MGVIQNVSSGAIVLLHAQHRFGRDPLAADTPMVSADVSKVHATIKWQGGSWALHDHSRNGTLCNKKIIHQSAVPLDVGAILQFGKASSTRWEILETSPPRSYLNCLDAPGFFLPSAPENHWCSELAGVSFYIDNRHRWYIEIGSSSYQLEHGLILTIEGKKWQYIENEVIDETIDNGQLVKNSYFQFELSHDEEHVLLHLYINGHHYNIGERTYNQLLLTLARMRIVDEENGVPFERQGWISTEKIIDLLSREIMRKVDKYYLNLQIHRVRKQLMGLKPYGYLLSGTIERQLGEIRFAHRSFEIIKGGTVLKKVR